MYLQLFGGKLVLSTQFSLTYWTKFLVLGKTCKVASRLRSLKGLQPEIGAKPILYINLVIDQNLCRNLLWFPGDIFWVSRQSSSWSFSQIAWQTPPKRCEFRHLFYFVIEGLVTIKRLQVFGHIRMTVHLSSQHNSSEQSSAELA